MKNILYTLTFFLIGSTSLLAQQYPLFTNYVTNRMMFNPAVVGTEQYSELRGFLRKQWVGIEGAPQTQAVMLNAKTKNLPFGIGGVVSNDVAGVLGRTGGSAILSYQQKLDSLSYLSIGVQAGYYRFKLLNNYKAVDAIDNTLSEAQNGVGLPDFNVGVYYYNNGLFAGFSVPQLFEKTIKFSSGKNSVENKLQRHYYGMVGYKLKLNDNISIEPSALLKYTEKAPFQWDAAVRLFLHNALWVGGSYRNQDAGSAMIGFDVKNALSIAYAYDFTTSSLNAASNGSHEINLGLKFGAKNKDRDKDGVLDKDDKCPDVPGPKENKGCPEEKKDELSDRDKDGVLDKDDKCPDVPGPKENQGCPTDPNKDTDGDGVPDIKDQCPTIPGLKENSGCPFGDRDGDGLRDDIDKCPDVAGDVKNEGCPLGDRDKDGIMDNVDPCPDEPGTLANQGCPPGKGPNASTQNDRDGDGVPDALDKCPNTAGDKDNFGCPKVSERAARILDFAIRNVYFDFDKAEIKSVSKPYLDGLAEFMVQNPTYRVKMAGHTDSRGTPDYNLELSKNRVYAILYYLSSKGVSADRVNVSYYGESRPVATNINEQGRTQNRRVEMEWWFE